MQDRDVTAVDAAAHMAALREAFLCYNAGDVDGLAEVLDPDVTAVVHTGGAGVSGVFRGRDPVLAALQRVFEDAESRLFMQLRARELEPGLYRVDWRALRRRAVSEPGEESHGFGLFRMVGDHRCVWMELSFFLEAPPE